MSSVDYHSDDIERDIGDPWKRIPHFVQSQESLDAGDPTGVLYIPDPGGSWKAAAFKCPEDAIEYLKQTFPRDESPRKPKPEKSMAPWWVG